MVLVGDPDAAVQGFRGAEPEGLLEPWPGERPQDTVVLRGRYRVVEGVAPAVARLVERIGVIGRADHRAGRITEAEYTDAPDSETITDCGLVPPACAMRSAISRASFSVSREAVPSPTARSSTRCLAVISARIARACSHLACPWCG